VKNHLVEKGPDGKDRALPGEKFYIPGSLLKAHLDNTNPLAYGMSGEVDVFYDNSPVFRMEPTAAMKKTNAVGWFSGAEPLDSGWAWGQQYLEGGTVFAEASVGEGKVFLLGPEVNFTVRCRSQFPSAAHPHPPAAFQRPVFPLRQGRCSEVGNEEIQASLGWTSRRLIPLCQSKS
jgi:hypothetical protein